MQYILESALVALVFPSQYCIVSCPYYEYTVHNNCILKHSKSFREVMSKAIIGLRNHNANRMYIM